MRKQTYYILGFSAVLSLVVACTDSKVYYENGGTTETDNYKGLLLDGQIGWNITTENGSVRTRAQGSPASVAAIRKEKDETKDIHDNTVDVGVFGYYTGKKNFWSITDTAGDNASIQANLFINERLTWKEETDTAYWSHPTHRHWPADNCTFLAYSPYLWEIPGAQIEQYKKDGLTNNRYPFFYRDYDKPGSVYKYLTGQSTEASERGWYKGDADRDSLLHLTEYRKGDTVVPAIRYIMPYHLAIHPDILYGTYGTGRFQDIKHDSTYMRKYGDYVPFTMRHALAKSYWYLNSQIDLSNTASLLGTLNNSADEYSVLLKDMSEDDIKKSPYGEKWDTGDTVWTLDRYYYVYKRKETKLVIEELTFMDFYDRGTLPLLNDGVPQWYDREPNVTNADNGLKAEAFNNPINRAIVYNALLNDTMSLNWDQYDPKFYAGFSQSNPTNEYKDSAGYTGTFLVRRLDADGKQMNANFGKDPRFASDKEDFSIKRDTSDFNIDLSRWDTWRICHVEGADDNNGVMDKDDGISILGDKGQYYVMNIPQEASVWTPLARLRYRTIGYDVATRMYQYKHGDKTRLVATNYDDDHNFSFYVVNPQRTSSGYFERDLVGGRRYKMKIGLNAEYLEILADIQDWDVEDITYSDVRQGVTVAQGGTIVWKQTDGYPKWGTSGENKGKLYLNQFNGEFTFNIASPIGATWTATLVTTGGDTDAFNFYTDNTYTTSKGTTISGTVDGKFHTVYVRAVNLDGQRSDDNTAILRFFITYADGSGNSELITQLTGTSDFSEWTLVQTKN